MFRKRPKEIFTTLVQSEDGASYRVDTIENEHGLWLVPQWRTVEGVRQPARLIRLDTLPYREMADADIDYLLSVSVPTALLEPSTPQSRVPYFEVIEMPD